MTCESAMDGHPDKMADLVSDSVLDFIVSNNSFARAGIEVLLSPKLAVIAGETSADCLDRQFKSEVSEIARSVFKRIPGYNPDVRVVVERQSQNLANNAESGLIGDQGVVYGLSLLEDESGIPKELARASKISMSLSKHGGSIGRDGKVQVSSDGRVFASVMSLGEGTKELALCAISKMFPGLDVEVDCFLVGGPFSDCGLTGRKTQCDSYGGQTKHGGGAFSGKDASKPDRSYAYFARLLARKASDFCGKPVLVEISLEFGKRCPRDISFFDYEKGDRIDCSSVVGKFKTDLPSVIDILDLRRPKFSETTNFGHFGRKGFAWEDI